MVVKRHYVNFPEEFVLRAMIDSDGEIASIVEATELRWWNCASVSSSCSWLVCTSHWLWSHQRGSVTTNATSLLKSCTWIQNLSKGQIHNYVRYKDLRLAVAAALASNPVVGGSGSTLSSFLGIWVAGKSPKAECCDFGRSLLFDVLYGFMPVLWTILLRWSSLIIRPAW